LPDPEKRRISLKLNGFADDESSGEVAGSWRFGCAHGDDCSMWRGIFLVLMLALCGCTHIKLQGKTISQGSTLSQLQYQQVLDNIAMFACDPNSLAWHVKVTGGVVQVSDQGNAAVVPAAVGSAQLAPNIGGSRNILEQWNLDTVIESDDLTLLQLAYQKAVDPADAERRIKKEVYENICELSSNFQIVLSREISAEMIGTFKINVPAEQQARLNKIEAGLVELYKRAEELSANEADADRQTPEGPGGSAVHTELANVKHEIIKLTSTTIDQPFMSAGSSERPRHSATVIEQAEEKIKRLVELVSERSGEPNVFSLPWIGQGCKKDVPKCACYVGHYRGCKGDCYVWVMPEHAKTLRDFTLTILSLVPPDAQDVTPQRLGVGAAFSPGI
jgi:hypothetical protein